MSLDKVQYVSITDSRLIANGVLDVAGTEVPLSNFDFAEFGSVQRKTLIGWSGKTEGVKYGAAVSSRKISTNTISLNVSGSGDVVLKLGSERITLGTRNITSGRYELTVDVYLDVPLKALGDVPAHVKPLLQYSEIVNVMMSLGGEDVPTLISDEKKHPVYDGYGQLGFFIADLERMNDYILSRLGDNKLNLKDAFCETEIAGELFEEGLLILVWGMTPWQYYIYGLDRPVDSGLVPGLNAPQFRGSYKFRSEIKRPSVVPGEFLLNWPECLNIDFPKIALEGDAEEVSIEVHVMGFHVVGGGVGPNLSVITACRQEGGATEPLLMVDIENVESELGFKFDRV